MEVIRGTNKSPASTAKLIANLSKIVTGEAFLYIGYPMLGSNDMTSVDALLLSKELGIIIFDIVEGTNYEDRSDIRDKIYNSLHGRFIDNSKLVKKRGNLNFDLGIITYAPAWGSASDSEEITSDLTLREYLKSRLDENIDEDVYRSCVATIQAITEIHKKVNRKAPNERSKAHFLALAEKSIANLDATQSRAVIETSLGIQRIRGLAGSGKTIILALKAAYLHSMNPDYNIAITFYSRSLKGQFKSLIYKFCIEQAKREPDFSKIHILQAWGGPKEAGLYYKFCIESKVPFMLFDEAKREFNNSSDIFHDVCSKARRQSECANPEIYDAILIDEAQDFSHEFLKICYSMTKSHDSSNNSNKMVIYAYDELQKLNESERLGSPKEIFGDSIDFENTENGPRQDVILDVCYRNSKSALVTAHALGFGVKRENGYVTMYKDKSIWKDIGYRSRPIEIEYGKNVTLIRSEKSSPDFLSKSGASQDLVTFHSFDTVQDQNKFVAEKIIKDIAEEGLNHRDIIVIDPNPFTYQKNVGAIRSILAKNEIMSHVAGITTSPDNFFLDDSIAFTSVFRAKGNEAAMVYVVNSHYCLGGPELIRKRNSLFTAITRSKGWVCVTGYGEAMEELEKEFSQVKKSDFRLSFVYPTEEKMDELNLIHGDLSKEEFEDIENIEKIISDIAKGNIDTRRLSPETQKLIRKLRGA